MIVVLINRVVAPSLNCSRDKSSGTLCCPSQWGGLRKTALIGGGYLQKKHLFQGQWVKSVKSTVGTVNVRWQQTCYNQRKVPFPNNYARTLFLSNALRTRYCRTVLHLYEALRNAVDIFCFVGERERQMVNNRDAQNCKSDRETLEGRQGGEVCSQVESLIAGVFICRRILLGAPPLLHFISLSACTKDCALGL